jgi:hypothetical protein
MGKKFIAKALKFAFSGFSLFFIGMLFFIVVHETMTGEYSTTSQYYKKYGFLSSHKCWKNENILTKKYSMLLN